MRLRRQIAFDRLLARLFVVPDPPWLLNGGYAFELRLGAHAARATKDIDLSIPMLSRLDGTFAWRHTHAILLTLEPPPEMWQAQFAAVAAECELHHSTLQEAFACVATYWQVLGLS